MSFSVKLHATHEAAAVQILGSVDPMYTGVKQPLYQGIVQSLVAVLSW